MVIRTENSPKGNDRKASQSSTVDKKILERGKLINEHNNNTVNDIDIWAKRLLLCEVSEVFKGKKANMIICDICNKNIYKNE